MTPRILLTTLNAKYIHLNLAIRILYDLNKDYADLTVHEFTIKSPDDEMLEVVRDYDILCFSCYIWNITPTLAIAQKIKAAYPHIKILLGGPEVSYEWEGVIALPYIDYIIVGEGELPFHAFVTAYPNVLGVPQLIYKDDTGRAIYNDIKVQFPVANLGDRNPYQYDADIDLHNKICYIETSRGCPYKCSFCLASLDNKVRYLPMDTIKDNLKYLMDRGRVIKFLDRTFNIKKDFTLELFDFILKHHRPGNVFQFEITADIIHSDIIRFINDRVPPGLFRFEIGIQTVNRDSNLAVKRKQDFEKTKSIIKQIQDKIELHLDLIVGLPLDYIDDIKYSFEQTFQLFAPELQLGFLKFLKGTPVRAEYEAYDYVYDSEPPYQIISSRFLSQAELYQITMLEHSLEIYWNKKKAIHTLKYITLTYSIFDYLRDLGIYFSEHYDFHRHTLQDSYRCAYEFTAAYYPDDTMLPYLITLDYYLYYKVKPQAIFLPPLDKRSLFSILDADKQFNLNKYRYEAFTMPIDIMRFIQHHEIIYKDDTIVIAYDGVHKPRVTSVQLQSMGL